MIALYREPMNHEVHDEHEENCAATLCECELPGYREQVLGFDRARKRRALPSLADFAVGLVCVACVMAFVWLLRVGEP